ncbi:MAG: LysR family transcriptional regulator [Rhodobacterales bacterium]|nr:LysR family transcriptional regulator [Rhodobacterales bacterium]
MSDTGRLGAQVKLRQLRILVAIADHGSLVRAGRHLGISQPAVTRCLKELEDLLGLPLFLRTARGVAPTAFGARFIDHAKAMLAELRYAEEDLADVTEAHAGRVAVGTLLAAAPRLLPKAVARLKAERPAITVTVVEGTNDRLLPALRVGDLDLVVGRLPEAPEDGLDQEVLYTEPIRVVVRAGHPLAGRAGLRLADLADCQWILPLPETALRRQIEDDFRAAGVAPPAHPIESVSILTVRTLLLETDCVGVLPSQVILAEEELNLLRALPVDLRSTLRPVGIITRAGRGLTPAAQRFADQLRLTAADLGLPA